MNKKGFILPQIMMLSFIMCAIASTLSFMTIKLMFQVSNETCQQKAFYLAESGLEMALDNNILDPNWHTDADRGSQNEKEWVISKAIGLISNIEEGTVKIVREQGENTLYAIGYLGDNIEKPKARAIIRIKHNPSNIIEEWSLI
jgi:hypothetical protein